MLTQTFPYFIFEGEAKEAYDFYADALSAEKISFTQYKDNPDDPEGEFSTAEVAELVMNAELRLSDGTPIMFTDNFPSMPFVPGNTINQTLVFDNADETKELFNKLAVEGNVTMDIQETFWSPAYGTLTDKFGVDWQISTEPLEANE